MISFLLESVNEDFLIKYQKKLTFLQNKSMVMEVTIDCIYWKGGIVMFKTFRKNTDKFITKIKRKIISGAHCI